MPDRLTDVQEVERVIAQCLKQRLEANAGTRPSGPTITGMAERVLAALPREDEGLREAVCTLAEIAEHDTNYPDRVTQKMARAALRRLDPSGTIRAKRPRDEPTPGGMTPGGKS